LRYWDSSAVVPLLVEGPTSEALRSLYDGDAVVVAWWGSVVECVSALARKERAGDLTPSAVGTAVARLGLFAAEWTEVQPSERVRRTAQRLLRVHELRPADALQLAAASTAAESMPFVTLDDRLALAAAREGFVLEPV
jgi:uncharacterized protein